MPIDPSRRRDPDNVLIERMANQLVAIRGVKHNVTVRDMLQRGWTRQEVSRLGDRAVRRAESIRGETVPAGTNGADSRHPDHHGRTA